MPVRIAKDKLKIDRALVYCPVFLFVNCMSCLGLSLCKVATVTVHVLLHTWKRISISVLWSPREISPGGVGNSGVYHRNFPLVDLPALRRSCGDTKHS